MLIAEARIESRRSSRYLVQLCEHLDRKAQALPDVNYKAQAHPEVDAHVEWSDDRGVASFGWGRCTLRADTGVLSLRAESLDERNLQRVEELVADHLERFAKRERLTVAWSPAQRVVDEVADTPAGHTERGHAHG